MHISHLGCIECLRDDPAAGSRCLQLTVRHSSSKQSMTGGARPSLPMSAFGTSRHFAALQNLSAIGRWSQRIDATLYLIGKRWSVTMDQRFRRGFTAAEKTELWDCWQRGESLKAIGRAFGKPS